MKFYQMCVTSILASSLIILLASAFGFSESKDIGTFLMGVVIAATISRVYLYSPRD